MLIANKELVFQNEEKEKRAAELVVANKELAFQNEEKEKRAAELFIANKELVFQNEEKEKRAAELLIANKELLIQNEEKEKRAAELNMAYKELAAFNYLSSHDLMEPLRKLQVFSSRIMEEEHEHLSNKGKEQLIRMRELSLHMQTLITDLRTFSDTNAGMRELEITDLNAIVGKVIEVLTDLTDKKQAVIEVGNLCTALVDPFQFYQIMLHLVENAIKFSRPGVPPHIVIKSSIVKFHPLAEEQVTAEKDYCLISVSDNGIGFEPQYKEYIFDIFKRLREKKNLPGNGIGLAIVKKIVSRHNGFITAHGELNKGARFDIYIPVD